MRVPELLKLSDSDLLLRALAAFLRFEKNPNNAADMYIFYKKKGRQRWGCLAGILCAKRGSCDDDTYQLLCRLDRLRRSCAAKDYRYLPKGSVERERWFFHLLNYVSALKLRGE